MLGRNKKDAVEKLFIIEQGKKKLKEKSFGFLEKFSFLDLKNRFGIYCAQMQFINTL